MRPFVRLLVLLLPVVFALAPQGFAQSVVTASNNVPVQGAGHDYVKMLNETVDPAGGNLNVDIQPFLPPGRHLTLPFHIVYNSNGVFQVQVSPGQINWQSQGLITPRGLSGAGWSYTLPQVFPATTTQIPVTQPPNPPQYCTYYWGWSFLDTTGGQHTFGLMSTGPDNPSNPGTPPCWATPIFAGGDFGTSGGYSASIPSTGPGSPNVTGMLVSDRDGTTYTFGNSGGDLGNGTFGMVSRVEDRNGNTINVQFNNSSSAVTETDTLGRTVLSTSGFGHNGDTISIAGLGGNYTITWGTTSASWNAGATQLFPNPGSNCGFTSPSFNSIAVITAITLPNGKQYQFQYDSTYGLLKKITYPTGATVTYTWGVNAQSARGAFPDQYGNNTLCDWSWGKPVVTSRIVSFDGVNPALEQGFSYAATVWDANHPIQWDSKQTTLLTNDRIRATSFATTYLYAPVFSAEPGMPAISGSQANAPDVQIAVEQTVKYFKDSNTGGTPLRTMNKTWLNERQLASEQITLDNGLTSKTTYQYNANGQVTEKDDYDFGQSTPSRKTLTTYQAFPATALFPALPSIVNRSCKVQIADGNGSPLAETDTYYDGGTTLCGAAGTPSVTSVSNLTSHDETNYAATSTGPRGNPTKTSKLCLQSAPACSSGNSTTTYAYDETGQVMSMTDARGNTTQYSYADNYASGTGTPPGNTNAFLTQTTYPQTGGGSHIERATQGYADGKKRTSVDQNNLTVSYQYNDSLVRPTQINFPDTGQAPIAYNDTARTITTSKTINVSQTATTVNVADGIGHITQSKVTTDPQGTVLTDTTYDGLGRVYTVSNPYRSGSDPSSNSGVTTYLYDALGRKITETAPDGSVITTAYSGNQTTVTDATGRERRSITDGLGRLIEVDESAAGAGYTASTAGTATVTVSGGVQQTTVDPCLGQYGSCPYTVYDSGTVSVTVNGFTAIASYAVNDGPASVATHLASALNVSNSPVTAVASGSSVVMTAKAMGAGGNYSFTTSYSYDTADFNGPSFLATPSSGALTGGVTGGYSLSGGYVTQYSYDLLNNLTCAVQKGTDTTAFTSCASAPAAWRPRSLTYNSFSQLVTAANPESGTITYTYDANGNVATKKDARNITTTYSYDALNRETSRTYSNGDPSVTITYDGTNCLGLSSCQNIGKRTGMTDAAGSEAWAYQTDAANKRSIHVDQRITNGITKTATYYLDLAGNVTKAVYPTGRTVNYTYDSAGRAATAADAANGITYAGAMQTPPSGCPATNACYTPQGSLYSVSIGQSASFTGLNLTHSYNNRLQPLEFKATSGAGNAMDITYSFVDPVSGKNAGHVYGITNNLDATRSQTFTYDALNRIVGAQTTSTFSTSAAHCWGETYGVDVWGNLQSIAATTNSAYTGCTQESGFTKTADTTNHLSGFSYDGSGNTSSDGTFSYAWDGESQLKSGGSVNYLYDGDGRRVSKSNGKLYWYGAGSEILAETNASGTVTAEYIFFGGQRIAMLPAGGNAQFYVADLLGSSRVITTNTGSVCYDADFYPFGGERTPYTSSCPAQNKYKFESKERDDETGNDNFSARYYSNRFGRWLSSDWSAIPVPVPYANLTNPQTLNLYAMVADDPETSADLDGHQNNQPGNAASPGGNGGGCGGGSDQARAQCQGGPDTTDKPQGQSPYQKYIEEQNRPATDADRANALKEAGEKGDAGVKAAMIVTAPQYAAMAGVAAVEAAPAVSSTTSQVIATVNTVSTQAYVATTSAIATAGTAINNAAAIALDRTKQAIVAVDTLRSGGGAFNTVASFVQGYGSGSATARRPPPNNTAGLTGFVVRLIQRVITQ